MSKPNINLDILINYLLQSSIQNGDVRKFIVELIHSYINIQKEDRKSSSFVFFNALINAIERYLYLYDEKLPENFDSMYDDEHF